MRIALFYHSLLSDWNHGNAHFLRGVANELIQRGHRVTIFEPREGWSLTHLRQDYGEAPLEDFRRAYPWLESHCYGPDDYPARLAAGANLVIAHEWNDPALIAALGRLRARSPDLRLLFHDTHHRAVSDPKALEAFELTHYDGVLAFGAVIRDLYLERGLTRRAWTWHEAADTRVFYPRSPRPEDDLVWIGNWGDDERSRELQEFLLEPVKALGLKARAYGVRYPDHARRALTEAGIRYGGWLPNFRVPEAFARARVTVHIPRSWYRSHLPGIPTIRPFEALACGIPLISAPWEDSEGLFTPGQDFLVARNGQEMIGHLERVLNSPQLAHQLAAHGRRTILDRHTCIHRVDELLDICRELELDIAPEPSL
ncbi:MAG: glycosyltransferase [Candidatus Competibacteraceae bacterium]|nr:glycosyltransferase [Candidatus Competibacteraceae bacterium]